MHLHVPTRSRAALVAGLFLLFVLPGAVDAHAELKDATPKDGAELIGAPLEISARYSEAMASKGSSLQLLDASGKVLGTGGVDPQDTKRMGIYPMPALGVGTYTVKSTTVSASDGDLDRTEWTFTVVELAPSPTPAPTPICTDGCNGQPTGELPTPTPTTAPTPTPVPSPSADGGSPAGSTGDVILPIVAAVVIVAGGALWFSRRGRPSSGA